MRYFVTGGTGFIGGTVVRQLRDAGHDVVALVRDPDKAQELKAIGVELAKGDVTRRDTIQAPMEGADGVFHLAAWYKLGARNSPAEKINVEGTRNVLDTMRVLNIAKGVYTSTLAINSDTAGQHRDETYRHSGPHLTAYNETKWRAHYEIAEPLIQEGLPLVIVMPGVVYGPGDTSQIGGLLHQAMEGKPVLLPGGRAGVCWSHVEDTARAHLLAMERGRPGESYIIAGPCHTFRECFETAARVRGRRLRALWVPTGVLKTTSKLLDVVEKVIPMPADYSAETMRATAGVTYYGDNSKARRELGFSPRSIEEGFASGWP